MDVSEVNTFLSGSGSSLLLLFGYLFCPIISTFLFLLCWLFPFNSKITHVSHLGKNMCQSNAPCNFLLWFHPLLQSNFMKCLSVITAFLFSFLHFLIHCNIASVTYSTPVNPTDLFPVLLELDPLGAFTASLFLETSFTMASWSSVFQLVLSPHLFLWKFLFFTWFLEFGSLKCWCSSGGLCILSPGIFSNSSGFYGLPLREFSRALRPTCKLNGSMTEYLHADAFQHYTLKMLQIMLSLPEFCFSFWMVFSSSQGSNLNQK